MLFRLAFNQTIDNVDWVNSFKRVGHVGSFLAIKSSASCTFVHHVIGLLGD